MSQFYDSLSDASHTAMTVHTNAANARQYIEYWLSNPLCIVLCYYKYIYK